ncbi:MAG TPA: hypothetical protein VJ698_07040 [Noviherbaspirillum sp.]|uniref:hypothetical protein n=1 Tax=Noviherbaspirillum sp. TaxID=1926288 RepID=UPI002B490408|nr:hypothetical protein [Noviherbaspirillum sp.]HJV85215.1 hypothetical protein [Noviherbaspirillum sp.]
MASYPSFNWWRGNLRPYESVISFVARFCAMNGITVQQYNQLFGYEFGHENRLCDADLERIAMLLNEDLHLVESVFRPNLTLDNCGRYGPVLATPRSDSVRYCKECSTRGYHSYLHEVHWLAKCPFHLCDLQTCFSPKQGGTIWMRKLAALKLAMTSACAHWPVAKREAVPGSTSKQFDCLAAWIKSASGAASRLSHGQFWDSGEGEFVVDSLLSQEMGRLRALEPMPKFIESLFSNIGEATHIEIRRFPLEARIELDRCKGAIPFPILLDFFKRLGACSKNPPPFIAKRKAAQDAIRGRHMTCGCQWGRIIEGWYGHWIHIDSDERLPWNYTCPNKIAVDELEFGWGCPDLSRYKADRELSRFIRLSHDMYDAGLISYTPDAHVSPEGHLYACPRVWPCCEWSNASSLTDLLNAVAEVEIESALCALMKWLDDIDNGVAPYKRDDPTRCLRLCETEDGLLLIKWSHPRMGGNKDVARN